MNKKTLLKVLALVLTAAVAFTVIHFAVLGNNTPTDTAFTFALEDGNAILTGASDPLSGAVMLPETIAGHTVTGIGDDAFKNCSDVTAFFLPDTITSIGSYAFENCTSLVQMILPEGLTRIGEGAFWKCSSLVSMTVPASVKRIGSCAFYKCSSLQSLVIPGAETPVKGIFNVALDIGQTIAVHNPAREALDPVVTTLYCYIATTAYKNAVDDMYSNYVLLKNDNLTEYTVRYVDEDGAELFPARTLTQQPIGIPVAAVAAVVDAEGLDYPAEPIQTITLAASDNVITFVYPVTPETTTAESTTAEETTVEETTTEVSTTEEPTSEEPSTAEETTIEETTIEETTTEETTIEETTVEETTKEETTKEETTAEATTEEETTEAPMTPPTLNAKEGSGAVLDRERGYIYGIEPETADGKQLSAQQLIDQYLDIQGDGHVEVSAPYPGTGSTIKLVSDIDGTTVEEFTLVIFGDLNSDGIINQFDMTILKGMIVGSITKDNNPILFVAGDLAMDDEINQFDRTFLTSVIVGASRYDQAARELVRT